MAEFDYTAAVLAELADLSTNDINDITGLRVTGGEHFDPMMEEIIDATRAAITEWDGADLCNVTGAEVMHEANIVPDGDGEILRYFIEVRAAHDYQFSAPCDAPIEHGDRVLDLLATVLNEVYIAGAQALLKHLFEQADIAELEHDTDEIGDIG